MVEQSSFIFQIYREYCLLRFALHTYFLIFRVPIVEKSVNLTRNGICHNVPSHLLIDVLISEAGMAYGQSQMEISGIRIRYFLNHTFALVFAPFF